jgi:hypothetical protein
LGIFYVFPFLGTKNCLNNIFLIVICKYFNHTIFKNTYLIDYILHLIDIAVCLLSQSKRPIMSTIKIKEINFSRKILCSFFGHKIFKTRNVTNHFKEYKCSVCGLELTNDLKGHKTFLTPELKEINETLISLHQKRQFSIQ